MKCFLTFPKVLTAVSCRIKIRTLFSLMDTQICCLSHIPLTFQYRQHRINSDKEKGHPVQKLNAQKYVHFSFAGRTGSDRQRFPVSQIQIRQCEHDIQFGGLFSQTPISCFSISKQSFDDGKNMFNFASYG